MAGNEMGISAGGARSRWSRRAVLGRAALFALWLGGVLWLAWRHAMWRDEGRAWSIALQGNSLLEMLQQLRGEGHPGLWYVLLRLAHDVSGSRLALPITAMAIMAASALLVLFAAPFRLWLTALILAGYGFVYEYAVMARNYGISALLLLVLAALYRRCRDRGVWLGVVCALLANTNVHSAIVVCAFMLFWLLDLAFEGEVGWNRRTAVWALNGCIATAGLIACAVSILPTYNDAVVGLGVAPGASGIITALALPASMFQELVLRLPARSFGVGPVSSYPRSLPFRVVSGVMFGALLGLIRWPAAAIAGAVSLLGMSLLFALIYAGFYRHQAIWLFFVIALYWMLQERGGQAARQGPVARLGSVCFVLLVALQVPMTVEAFVGSPADTPQSQVGRFAEALAARPDLRQATVLPDPDYLMEALPYYAPNPIYLAREGRFGAVSHFTEHAQLQQSLGDLMHTAQRLCQERQRPVVLVIEQDLDGLSLPASIPEGYNLTFKVNAAEFAALKASTEFLGRFTPATSDEVFGAYVLEPPCALAGWSG